MQKGLNAFPSVLSLIHSPFGREKEAKLQFDDLRRKVMDVYRSWSITNHNEVRATHA